MRRPIGQPGPRGGGRAAACAAALCAGLAAVPAAADFYVGAELGLADASALDSEAAWVSHRTRCDRRLYAPHTADPLPPGINDPVCAHTTPRTHADNRFELDAGFAGGLAVGMQRGRWRFELEYLHRRHGGERKPWSGLAGDGSDEFASKRNEWEPTELPSERASRFRADQLFANVYYDFDGGERWTPYLGAGAGWAATRLRYEIRFRRKQLDAYRDIAGTGLTPEDRPPAAAGTLSYLDGRMRETLFGFQLLAGADYALTDRLSVGVKARWARFGELRDRALWNRIRDHDPVWADGETPFVSAHRFDDLEYWAATAGIKRRF